MQLSNLERARSRGACAAGSGYRHARGFSLMEVMVALVVSTIGLLGLAKMEALAMSSTGVASSRSLAAIEASSLAAAMHANPGFWQAGTAQASYTISGTATTNPYAASPTCTLTGASSCSVQAMAFNDLNQWAGAVSQVLPGYVATINCSQANFPVTCTIELQWTENGVAVNAQQTQMGSLVPAQYILFVQP
jgi:type IV pilus assembly protein PilV